MKGRAAPVFRLKSELKDLILEGAALMFNNSRFGEIMKLLPRTEIKKLIQQHQSDRYRKTFKTWDHLIAMLTGQFAGVTSLRDLEVTLNSNAHHHYHLKCGKVKRSTLSDANKRRDFSVFRDVAAVMISRLGRQKKDLERIVTIFDSTLIRLDGRGHEWAKETQSRPHNQGLKLHVQYNHTDAHIEYVEVGAATVNDVTVAQNIPLEGHRIYVFDKGYCDYNWWKSMADAGSMFVTRLKKNAAYSIEKTLEIAEADKDFILKDQIIKLSNKNPRWKKVNTLAEIELRLVEIQHPNGKASGFRIVTNALEASAQQIAGWYKERWSIELLFKWLKQNLKIKKFMGETRNAIMIQLFAALIAYVLVALYHRLSAAAGVRLKDMCMLIRSTLFTRPKLYERQRERRRSLAHSSLQLSLRFHTC